MFASLIPGWQNIALAGLSASQVVVVVNGTSLRSRTVANHYIHLRNIPVSNVVVLPEVPNSETITVDEFREKILKPLLAELERRQLAGVVQCVAYSADFPTAIDISKDLQPLGQLPTVLTPVASINALTYFFRWVQNSDASYIGLGANFYARRPLNAYFQNPGGDDTKVVWDQIDKQIAAKEHSSAAKALEDLLATFPHQHPVAYLAASQYAMAGERANALRLLGVAIAKGWSHGQYLKDDIRFASLRDEPQFQALELSLDQSPEVYQPPIGFDARTFWSPNGVPKAKAASGMNYVLSVVLAVTRGGGMNMQDVITALERSSSADFTQPDGGFYFCLTGDVRTTTRQPGFDEAIRQLKELDFEAAVVADALPMNKPRVLGACIGTAVFDWPASGSVFVPGSLAENLTSIGGMMATTGNQTKLTELIRAGAAGSSGTVTEPYAIQAKFPHPLLYAHYAQGASLAEAFYLNVTGPYQLLVVGDPLCQPFANPRQLKIDTSLRTVAAGQTCTLQFDPSSPEDGKLAHKNWKSALEPAFVSVSLDTSLPQSGIFREKVRVALTGNEPHGYHDLRLAVTSVGELSIRREVALPLWIGEKDCVRIDVPKTASLLENQKFSVKVRAAGATEVSVWHDSEQIGVALLEEAEFVLSPEDLGLGPVRLHARAQVGESTIRSLPNILMVVP